MESILIHKGREKSLYKHLNRGNRVPKEKPDWFSDFYIESINFKENGVAYIEF